MITSTFVYYGVNIVLAVTCVVTIILAFKFTPDKRSRNPLIVASVLVILSGAILSFCLRIFKMISLAVLGDSLGRTEGAVGKVMAFRHLALLAGIFEVVAIALFVIVAKRLISLRTSEQSGEEARQ